MSRDTAGVGAREGGEPRGHVGWVRSRCQKNPANPPSCNRGFLSSLSALQFCGRLMDTHGAFEYEGGTDGRAVRGGYLAPGVVPSDLASFPRACLPHLKASVFLKNCVFDMCKFQRLQSVLCAHMAALTEICQDAGYTVKPWRGPEFCRELCRVVGPLPSQADASRGPASKC